MIRKLTVTILPLFLAISQIFAQQVRISEVIINPPNSLIFADSFIPDTFKKNPLEENILSLEEVISLEKEIVDQLVQQGFPYSIVKLDSVRINDRLIDSRLIIVPGERVRIDSLVIQPAGILNPKLLPPLIGMQKGDWFNHHKLVEAEERLRFLGLMDPSRSLEAGFFDTLAWIYVFPVKPKSNRFDGIVGLQPSSANGFPRLTGSLNLRLSNMLGYMEQLNVNWKSTGNQTQKLDAGLGLPYLFGTGFGLSANLDLYKRDTAYLLLNARAAGRYTFSPGAYAEAYFGVRRSRQILVNDWNEQGDFNLNLSGLSWSIDQIGQSESKRNGWRITQSLGGGTKNYASSADGEPLFYWEAETAIRYNLPIFRNAMLVIQADGGYRSGELQQNEQFRLGGARSIRGFQEEIFYTGSFIASTFEYRYYIGYQSEFHGFIDAGWLDGYGVVYAPGLGLNLETRAGILQLDYALGQNTGNGFSMKNGLIHLGIQSNF